MIVQIQSTNPDFLSMIKKNPNSFCGVQVYPHKNGSIIGYIKDNHSYDMIFHDTKYSYSEDTTNQIDFQGFCNPRIFLGVVSELLRHLVVDKREWEVTSIPWLEKHNSEIDVPGFNHSLFIPNLYVDGLSRNRSFVFEDYFPEVKLTHTSGNLYGLRIETTESLFRLINLSSLVCMYLSAINKQPWFIDSNMISKYIRIIRNLNPIPYFIGYMFAKRCINSHKNFEATKHELALTIGDDVELAWGTTQEMRIQAVISRFFGDNPVIGDVVEIGCGELDYPYRMLSRLSPDSHWYSNDKVDYSNMISLLKKRKARDNITFVSDLNDLSGLKNPSVMMIEVIEHMPEEDAAALIKSVIEKISPQRILITTPNGSFNKNFAFDKEFRHDDHHFEFSPAQFEDFIKSCIETKYRAEFFGIGDRVGENHLTLAAELFANA